MLARAKRLRVLLALAAALTAGGCRARPGPPRVTINGHSWRVELATTAEQRHRGLAGRESLAEDAGMLFVFPRAEVVGFHMKGCFIGLDVAFISAEGRVVRMHTMAPEPGQTGRIVYSSRYPAAYALEVGAGALKRAGVAVGDRVQFSGDIPAAAKGFCQP